MRVRKILLVLGDLLSYMNSIEGITYEVTAHSNMWFSEHA